jgi:hypothetical protein
MKSISFLTRPLWALLSLWQFILKNVTLGQNPENFDESSSVFMRADILMKMNRLFNLPGRGMERSGVVLEKREPKSPSGFRMASATGWAVRMTEA